IGEKWIRCSLAPKGNYMSVTIDSPGVKPIPEPVQFGRPPIADGQEQNRNFYIFGDGEPIAGFALTKDGRINIFDGVRSTYATLHKDTVLLAYNSWPLGVGIVLPENGGIFWPSRRVVWSVQKLTVDKVREGIMGDWEFQGKPTKIFSKDNKVMVQKENP